MCSQTTGSFMYAHDFLTSWQRHLCTMKAYSEMCVQYCCSTSGGYWVVSHGQHFKVQKKFETDLPTLPFFRPWRPETEYFFWCGLIKYWSFYVFQIFLWACFQTCAGLLRDGFLSIPQISMNALRDLISVYLPPMADYVQILLGHIPVCVQWDILEMAYRADKWLEERQGRTVPVSCAVCYALNAPLVIRNNLAFPDLLPVFVLREKWSKVKKWMKRRK